MATYNEVAQARQKAQDLTGMAGQMTAGSYDVPSVLKQKLTEAYSANQDIIQPLDQATSNYYSAPSVAREKYQNIFNPFEREKLVSQYTNTESLPMLSLSSILGQRMGSIADTLEAGTGAYNAQATAAANQAKNAQQLYNDLFEEYKFEQEQQLARDKMAADKGGTGTVTDMIKLLKGFDPSSMQERESGQAGRALTAAQQIEKANPEDLKVAAQLAYGGGGFGAIPQTWAKLTATPAQRELANAMTALRDTLRLEFTGAAFSPQELSGYSLLTGSDPLSVYADPTSSATAVRALMPYFESTVGRGKNPYQSQLDALMSVMVGQTGENEWEVYEQ